MIKGAVRLTWILLGWLELTLLSLPLYLLSMLPGERRGAWYMWVFRIWCRAFVHALGVDLRLHQKNRRPLPDRYLLIANHPSAFEDIGIPALFDVDSLAKIEVRDWWLVGRISIAAGTLFVDRESSESRGQAVKLIEKRLEEGRNVSLYPEGGVTGKRIHDRFFNGVFDISLRTGIPIVPVFIHYECQEDFFWGRHSLVQKLFQIMLARNNRANYYLYDAFEPHNFSDKQSYNQAVHSQYLAWQEKYLE